MGRKAVRDKRGGEWKREAVRERERWREIINHNTGQFICYIL